MQEACPSPGRAGLLLAGILLFWLAATPVCASQKIVTVPTRAGVTVRVLLETPASPPAAVLLVFPGARGAHLFKERQGRIRLGRNFLVRSSPKFVAQGCAVAIVDTPSDHPDGMSDAFRTSAEHTQDIRRIIDFLDARGLTPLYLVGTSRGTLSVAHLGITLQDKRVKGLVLTSSLGGILSGYPLSRITLPVLMVHNRDDGCRVSPFAKALALKSKFSGSPGVDFVEVTGGAPPQSGPCRALSYHGFFGREDQVVRVITDWVKGKPIPAQVGN